MMGAARIDCLSLWDQPEGRRTPQSGGPELGEG